jgi:hypothetical protein
MNYQEKQATAYLISSLMVTAGYSIYLFQKYEGGGFETTTIPSSWGTVILIVIGVQIVLSILMSILVHTVQALRTMEKEPTLSDERDQIIDMKANRVSYIVFGIGFLLAMISLAGGLPPLVMFNLIVFSLFGAGIVGYIVQLYLYRRGF